MRRVEEYTDDITIQEWIDAHPDYEVDDTVCEGYGDGYIDIEQVLDETDFEVFIDEEEHYAEFAI